MKRAAIRYALISALLQMCLAPFSNICPWCRRLDWLDIFFRFGLNADGLSLVLLFSIGLILFISLLTTGHFIKDEEEIFNFANLSLLALSGMNGVVLTTDIFSMYVFLEITAVISYIMIAFHKDKNALEATFKYIILSTLAAILILSSIALILLVTGGTGFSVINTALKDSPHSFLIMFAVALFLCGLFIKSGLVPFHWWLPDAYSAAPAPVSILLAGIVTKTLGVYTLMRVAISVIGLNEASNNALLLMGSISIVFGALAALGQTDFKRMLAYSSISQVGYIIVGLGCATPLGIFGAVFHIFNHAVFKSLLFVNASAVELQAGTRDMDKLGGLASKMPVTGVTSVLSSLSASGMPPLAGFWSKLIIVMALWMAGYKTYSMIAVLAGVLTLAYFLSIQRKIFFGTLRIEFADIKEAGLGLTISALLLAVITVAVGLVFPFVFNGIILK